MELHNLLKNYRKIPLRLWQYSKSLILLFIGLAALPQILLAAVVKTDHVEAEIIAENSALQLGQSQWLALRLKMIPGWHVYWRNPGDTGIPVSLHWEPTEGVHLSEIYWPYPERINVAGLTSFGFHNEIILPLEITLASSLPGNPDNIVLHARADWLVCEKSCIPETVNLTFESPISMQKAAIQRRWAENFQHARASLPRSINSDAFSIEETAQTISLEFDANLVRASEASTIDFFSYAENIVQTNERPKVSYLGKKIRLSLKKSDSYSPDSNYLSGILVVSQKSQKTSLTFSIAKPLATAVAKPWSWTILLFAFLGGILLNLMPCVFPVLSLKVLDLINQSGQSKRQAWTHTLAYTVGVLSSFLALASLLLILRATGEQLGWGFQLQSPQFVFFLIALMFLLALNLLGFFHIGGSIMGFGHHWTQGDHILASFCTGALAVIVATPCSAPFMGTALGVALSEPAPIMLLVFLCLGLGMVFPYLLIASLPKSAHLLPKPGRWMLVLKELLAFPLLLTCVWLIWVFVQLNTSSGLTNVLLGLLSFTFAIWLSNHMRHTKARSLLVLVFFALGFYFGFSTSPNSAQKNTMHSDSELVWNTFDPKIIEEKIAENRYVFINFTAAWCITCKVNEKIALQNFAVRKTFIDKNVYAIKADWTNHDSQITMTLEKYSRAGVPLYLLFSPGSHSPKIFPQILTPQIIIDAFSSAESKM